MICSVRRRRSTSLTPTRTPAAEPAVATLATRKIDSSVNVPPDELVEHDEARERPADEPAADGPRRDPAIHPVGKSTAANPEPAGDDAERDEKREEGAEKRRGEALVVEEEVDEMNRGERDAQSGHEKRPRDPSRVAFTLERRHPRSLSR